MVDEMAIDIVLKCLKAVTRERKCYHCILIVYMQIYIPFSPNIQTILTYIHRITPVLPPSSVHRYPTALACSDRFGPLLQNVI